MTWGVDDAPQLAMSWGVETFKTVDVEHTDEMVRQCRRPLLRIGRVVEGDMVVIIAGSPPGIPGSTNARCASTRWATPSTRSRRRTSGAEARRHTNWLPGRPLRMTSRDVIRNGVPRVGFEPTLDGFEPFSLPLGYRG